MKPAYYNEFDAKAAAWLRELIKAGLIADGDVDERSIADVNGSDLEGYGQCHFFAGIGGWSYALRLAGIPDEWPVWTGSCPCQPYSQAGKGLGDADERNLWPEFRRLIAECGPAVVFGEQVERAIRHGWIDRVQGDLEKEGYAVGYHVLGAHSVGQEVPAGSYIEVCDSCGDQWEDCRCDDPFRIVVSFYEGFHIGPPHIRQRLFWVADGEQAGWKGRIRRWASSEGTLEHRYVGCDGAVGGMVDTDVSERGGGQFGFHEEDGGGVRSGDQGARVGSKRLGDAEGSGQCTDQSRPDRKDRQQLDGARQGGNGGDAGSSDWLSDVSGERRDGGAVSAQATGWKVTPADGAWSQFDVLPFRDGKARRVEAGTFPLAHGVSGRVGLLRGYGNAIVPEVAAAFVEAWREARGV